jgi:hypothetical protein
MLQIDMKEFIHSKPSYTECIKLASLFKCFLFETTKLISMAFGIGVRTRMSRNTRLGLAA